MDRVCFDRARLESRMAEIYGQGHINLIIDYRSGHPDPWYPFVSALSGSQWAAAPLSITPPAATACPSPPSGRREFLDMVKAFDGASGTFGARAPPREGRVAVSASAADHAGHGRHTRGRAGQQGAPGSSRGGSGGRVHQGTVFCPFTTGCLSSSPPVDIPRPSAQRRKGAASLPGSRPQPHAPRSRGPSSAPAPRAAAQRTLHGRRSPRQPQQTEDEPRGGAETARQPLPPWPSDHP